MSETVTFEELRTKLIEWGENKGIVSPYSEVVFGQMKKVAEEMTELVDAYAAHLKDIKTPKPNPNTWEHVTMELGDVMVTIIMTSAALGIHPVYALDRAYEKIKNRTGKYITGQFVKSEDL